MKNFVFLLVLIAFSCVKETGVHTVSISNFDKTIEVKPKDVGWLKTYKISGAVQIDSFLVISNSKGDYVFQIYNTNTKKLIKETGSYGRGPGEYKKPKLLNQFERKDDSIELYVTDTRRKLIASVNVKKMLEGENYIEAPKQLSKKFLVQTSILKIGDNVLGISSDSEGRIFNYNTSTSDLNFWSVYPKSNKFKSFSKYELYVLYSVHWAYNKDKNKLVAAYNTYYNQLVFFDVHGKPQKIVKLPSKDHKLKKRNPIDDIPMYVNNIWSNDKCIYVMYSNYLNSKEYKCFMNVYDWEGNPIKQYQIKDYELSRFVVDEINKKVYAYARDNIDSQFVEFDL
jgi:hypothetical protein